VEREGKKGDGERRKREKEERGKGGKVGGDKRIEKERRERLGRKRGGEVEEQGGRRWGGAGVHKQEERGAIPLLPIGKRGIAPRLVALYVGTSSVSLGDYFERIS